MMPDQQNQGGVNSAPQQTQNGQYQVVPPLPTGQNNGHSGHNPYEFIVNPGTPKKAGFKLFGGGMPLPMLIAIIGVTIAIILAVAAAAISSLTPKGSTPELKSIAQQQQEIIRISTAAGTTVKSQDIKNFAVTVQAVVTTDQQALLSYLTSNGTKMSPKLLVATQSADTDTLLANATGAGTYDAAVVQVLADQLKTYEDSLKTTYNGAGKQAAKQLLQNTYATTDKLVQQSTSLSKPTN